MQPLSLMRPSSMRVQMLQPIAVLTLRYDRAVVAAISSAMQIQDPTLSHLPRVISVTVALMLLGPWMAHELSQFTREVFTQSIAAQR